MINRAFMYENAANPSDPRHYYPRRTDEFRNPSSKIYAADGAKIRSGVGNNLRHEAWAPISAINAGASQGSTSGGGLSGRHHSNPNERHNVAIETNTSGGSNIVYFDGHGGYRNWLDTQPWISSNSNAQNQAAYNQGLDMYREFWDPQGDHVISN
jgi:prepilin-type processing-associated H-X9-DG protein